MCCVCQHNNSDLNRDASEVIVIQICFNLSGGFVHVEHTFNYLMLAEDLV